MSQKRKLSVVLVTFNEETNIGRCLNAVMGIADEIVVVDGNSTDKTRQILKKYRAKVIKTSNKPMFHTNKQMAINAASGRWILQLDADEVVDAELCSSIGKIVVEDTPHNAFWLKRKNYFLGRFMAKGGQYPDPVIRLFRRGKAHLPQKDVHEQMSVEGTIGEIDGHLEHFNAPTFRRYIVNANRYTTLTAQQMMNDGVQMTVVNDVSYLLWRPFLVFLKLYLRHKGFVDGFPGFVFALFSGLHPALAYMKLGDLYREKL